MALPFSGVPLCLKKIGAELIVGDSVKFSNSFFKERVDVIKGGREIMRKMGYTEDIDGGMAFPEGADSDPNVIAELICDILMMKYEITNLLNGEHPAPEILVDLIKPAAKSQLQVLQSVLDFQKNNREAPEQKGDSGQNFVVRSEIQKNLK
ncbi:E3 ubiquitin-protein ligase RNF31-like [Argopecten irradians]|uniref:E3 ubiquitin-protein ligase RNF31-like n=1 Tax=Argopecten irradians TaxID=31199 RepID=UPI003718D587